VTVKADGNEVKAGNEVVLFRHEKTFYNRPGLFVKYGDDQGPEALKAAVAMADAYVVNYVGMTLTLDGFAVEAVSGDAAKFAAAVKAVREATKRPLILVGKDPTVLEAGLKALPGESPMLYAANSDNWESLAALAKGAGASLAVVSPTLDALADLTEKVKSKGLEDLALGLSDKPERRSVGQYAGAAVGAKELPRSGLPAVTFPRPEAAVQAIAKSLTVILDSFAPETVYPLLVLRQNIYRSAKTDPGAAGYEIGRSLKRCWSP
jgi:acetyl-CoA decarbonylase/synthase complex subunit gamma